MAALAPGLHDTRVREIHALTMRKLRNSNTFFIMLVCFSLLEVRMASAAQVSVVHRQGEIHGFLVLRNLDGEAIAEGDLAQVTRGDRVTAHLVFHFKDGSVNDETTVFTQRGTFRLISDHLVQKGPAFKRPMDLVINGSTGQATVRYTDDDGQEKVVTELLKLPPDVANGVLFPVLTNIKPDVPKTTVSLVVATPKPRIVKLVILPESEDPFSTVGFSHKATRYVVKVDIGGAAGVVAPLIGKQPPDTHVWIVEGEAPVVIKSEGPMFDGGPVWRTELTNPVFPPKTADVKSQLKN
jgi:hypothetical protein